MSSGSTTLFSWIPLSLFRPFRRWPPTSKLIFWLVPFLTKDWQRQPTFEFWWLFVSSSLPFPFVASGFHRSVIQKDTDLGSKLFEEIFQKDKSVPIGSFSNRSTPNSASSLNPAENPFADSEFSQNSQASISKLNKDIRYGLPVFFEKRRKRKQTAKQANESVN